jgi:CO/xanthine dehydrogenase FAD-binding subunit
METVTGGAYERPAELDSALRRLGEGGWSVLAGGTDFYPARVGRTVRERVLDIGGLPGLRGCALDHAGADSGGAGAEAGGASAESGGASAGCLRIGALTTWSDLVRNPLPAGLEALAMAASEVGGLQIQNQGTVGGNLCNASPAADGVVALLALEAQVELASASGSRRLPLSGFVLGNRRTARRPDELLVAMRVPLRARPARSLFLKLGHRRSLVISIAMVGLALELGDDGRIARCAVAVGACSAAALRLPALEARVCGLAPAALAREAAALADDDALAPLAPIDDVRGTAAYRRDAVRTLLARGLRELADTLPAART